MDAYESQLMAANLKPHIAASIWPRFELPPTKIHSLPEKNIIRLSKYKLLYL